MNSHSQPDDDTPPLGTTWRHTYATGHEGLITKVADVEFVVEVQPPQAADEPYVATVAALQAGIDAADAQVGVRSSAGDWLAG
jgi:hypothetical protein